MVVGQRREVLPLPAGVTTSSARGDSTSLGAASAGDASEERALGPSDRRIRRAMTDPSELPPPLTADALRWVEHVHLLEYVTQTVPRRTGGVAAALAMLDRDLPMGSRDIANFARTGHETVRRAADALYELGLIDRHRRPLVHARADIAERSS